MFYQDFFTPSIGEKLVVKREFNNTMDKQAVKEVKGDEMVGLASSRIVWYFLARSGEIRLEVIGRRRCEEWWFHGSLNLAPQTK